MYHVSKSITSTISRYTEKANVVDIYQYLYIFTGITQICNPTHITILIHKHSENRYTFGKLIFLVNAVIILVRYIFHISVMEPG